MTLFHKETLPCPFCTADEEVLIWDRIDLAEDPDLKDRIYRKDIQSHICQNCGETYVLSRPFLYVDQQSKLQIYYCPQYLELLEADGSQTGAKPADGAAAAAIRERDPATNLPPALTAALEAVFPAEQLKAWRLRLTLTYNQLIEKMHLADHHMDDRIMEVVKLALRSRYLTEENLLLEEMYFLSANDDSLMFEVREAEKGWYSLESQTALYRNAETLLAGRLPAEGRWTLADHHYAAQLIQPPEAAPASPATTADGGA
ncbi:hypothetical protein HCH52_10040 [Oscillospiraceae bacterium HV4-5-C5C]|nr:hypothetical protein [Oscillospiraceae bacterium HV4-5-C5C]